MGYSSMLIRDSENMPTQEQEGTGDPWERIAEEDLGSHSLQLAFKEFMGHEWTQITSMPPDQSPPLLSPIWNFGVTSDRYSPPPNPTSLSTTTTGMISHYRLSPEPEMNTPVSSYSSRLDIAFHREGLRVALMCSKAAFAFINGLEKEKRTSRKYGTTKISITLEDLRQHFGKKRKEAAENLGVSVSTVKRISRKHGIRRWPFDKKNKGLNTFVEGAQRSFNQNFVATNQHPGGVFRPIEVNQSAAYLVDAPVMQLETPMEQIPEFSRIELPCFNALPKQLATTTVQPSPPETTMADVRSIMTVKAQYGNCFIKFDLSSSAKMADLKKEVAKRLPKVGSFTVKYMDEDNDWVLIGCDEDLLYCTSSSRSLDRMIIKMLVE